MSEPILTCPNCGSALVTVESHQMVMANSGAHYCHSMKVQDPDSPATCIACRWTGQRQDLKGSQHD